MFFLLFLGGICNLYARLSCDYCWKIVDRTFDSIASLIEVAELGDMRADINLKALENIALSRNNAVLNMRYRYWNAFLHGNEWNLRELGAKERYLQETLLYVDSSRYGYDHARIRFLMLSARNNVRDYLSLYRNLSELSLIFRDFGDSRSEAHCYRMLGILFAELQIYDQALEYMDKADVCYARAGLDRMITTNRVNKAVVFWYMGYNDTAEKMVEALVKDTGIQKDTNVMVTLYNNLALMTVDEQRRNDYRNAALLLTHAYKGLEQTYLEGLSAVNVAKYYLERRQVDSAIMFYRTAIQKAESDNSERVLLPALEGISQCYAMKEDHRQAYTFLRQFHQLQDSIKGNGKVSEINRKEAGMAIEEYQNRVTVQEQKLALQKRQTVMISISFACLAIALLVVLIYLRQKKHLTETILRNKELQNLQLRQEIDSQNRELSSNMLILSEKKFFLQQMLVQFEKFRTKGDMVESCEHALRKMIMEHIRSEDEWDSFKMHFEKVHPGFFAKLEERHPNLSGNDLKLCAYIRIGLSIKQIAQMTAVLPATIKTNRYLLRKKMRLTEEQSLDHYINSL